MNSDTLGKRLNQARVRAGISQEKLANACAVTQGAISKIERGDQNVSTKINEFAKALECDPYWLATGEGDIVPIEGEDMAYIKNHIESLTDAQRRRLIDMFNDMVELNSIKGS